MFKLDATQDLPTVLLIDDDMVSREVMATVLTMSGYSVHTAAGGDAALKLLAGEASAAAVILMDAQMPGISGLKLIDQLRAHSQAALYAISGSNPPPEVVAACDGFLLKPFAPEALTRLLEDHIENAPPLPPVPRPAEPVVNPETLAQLRELMPDAAVRQIYAAIVADLVKREAAIQVALTNGDTAEIRRIGHSIKGGCSMAGALQAAALGALLENGALEANSTPMSANGNHLDNNSPLLQDLRTAAASLQRMLEAEFPA
ncbi:MAG: response regulator [Terracidiphilus sp.]|jgi:CheY-like chemotaxis protein